jgi:hypothetical protein
MSDGLFGRTALSGRPSFLGSSRQRTATASAVAALFDGGRGQCLRTWFLRVILFRARSDFWDCPRIFVVESFLLYLWFCGHVAFAP